MQLAHPWAEMWCPASPSLFSARGSLCSPDAALLPSSSSYSLTSFTSFIFSTFTTKTTMNYTRQGRRNKKHTDDFIAVNTNTRLEIIHYFWVWTDKPVCAYQEPVDVHEQQSQEERVEEEVEGDVGDGLKAGHTCGVQHFKREPVQTEPEPERTR